MQTIRPEPTEDERQLALQTLPLGQPGTGMIRYGAAMYFYRRGMLDADTLEAHRICCNLDFEDPQAVARSRPGNKTG